MKIIDNRDLIPAYKPDSEIQLEDLGYGIKTPEWVKTLILEEINVNSATPNGKFSEMPKVLDHIAELGVNGLWLTPFFGGVHYWNYGPSTINYDMTGTNDIYEGYKVLKEFVDEAHKRNIRIFFDIITWGTNPDAPIVKERPDFFEGYSEQYDGPLFNWNNPELEKWFGDWVIQLVEETGVDGLRADCGVVHCGLGLYDRIRKHFYSKGKYIVLMSEKIQDGNETVFDFSEHSFDFWVRQEGRKFVEDFANVYSGKKADIVGAVLEGKGIGTPTRIENGTEGYLRFYTSIISCHDTQLYMAQGRLIYMIYASILSPFIPLWYIGEEWNNPYVLDGGWLYRNPIFWDKLEDNREFYEQVKKAIRIRRSHPEIFEYFPLHLRDSNLCKVETNSEDTLPAYARFNSGKGILCIPNRAEESVELVVTIPFESMNITPADCYTVKDMMTDEILLTGTKEEVINITLTVLGNGVRVIGISADNSL